MRKAFTLIEVMVVLSILAIIAILGYNFFGSTMKEARLSAQATKIFNDFTTFNGAWEEYVGKYGASPQPSTYSWLHQSDIFDKGILTSYPTPPDGACGSHGTCNPNYYIDQDDWNRPGTATADPDSYVHFIHVSDELCIEYNKRYAPGIGARIWDNIAEGTPSPLIGPTACIDMNDAEPEKNKIFYWLEND